MTTLLMIFELIACLAIGATGSRDPLRRLAPEASIIHELRQQLADGVEHPRFTISAIFGGDQNLFESVEPFEIDVVLTNPSVTNLTSFSVNGLSSSVTNSINLLVADQTYQAGTRANNFAIIAVDEDKGFVRGIIQKTKQLVQLEQLVGQPATVTEVKFTPDDDWTCFLDSDNAEIEQVHNHDSRNNEDHEHLEKIVTGIITQDMETTTDGYSVQNPFKKLRQLYATDTFPNKWSYQVDLYIEVDGAFVNNHDTDTVNMPNTIAYLNTLVTAISAIYEQEVDTHLNVLHIAKTNIYDGAANVSVALDIMKKKYSGSTWHYTDPISGQKPDLHHALLYKTPKGGYATVGGVCDSRIGYGVSGGVQGTLANIGTVYWDLVVMAHELGHNFGSRHTHDSAGYKPLVDACGNDQCNSLVTGNKVSAGDASIMSYCHTCTGGVKNMGTSFGGYWYEDNRRDINNWKDNDGLIPFSQNPKRVPKVLYDYVSSKGNCVKPYLPIDIQNCTIDTDCHDGNSCTIDSCDSGQCSNAMQNNCCGNFICEVGESNCSDCGPFAVKTPSCSTCLIPYGEMFDVEAIKNITLTSIEFMVRSGSNTVTIFTAPGRYSNKQRNSTAWTKIYNGTFVGTSNAMVSVDFEDIKLRASSFRAFYIASTGQVLTLANNNSSPLARDSNLKLLHPTRGVQLEQFGNGYSNIISWVGSMFYKLEAPISALTAEPTAVSTPRPVTTPPTFNTSITPSRLPTVQPRRPPSNQPVTSQPQFVPSMKPTTFPSKAPTANPSKTHTAGPVTSPTSLSPSGSRPPSSNTPIRSPTSSPLTNEPTKAQSTLTPTLSQPSKQPVTAQPSTGPPSFLPTKAPVTFKPTTRLPSSGPVRLTSTPTKNAIPPQPSKQPVTPQPSEQPSTLKPTLFQPSMQPSKEPAPTRSTTEGPSLQPSQGPVTLKPTVSSPSPRPITSQPSMLPVTPSPTLLYSVDLCFPGCGNFTDVDTNNELEDLILKYMPCRSKKCSVEVIAESNQCSVCKLPSFSRQRFLQDGSSSLQSSAITFEIISVIPLNVNKVTSNLNNNIENANYDLSANGAAFRVDSSYTGTTRRPTPKPTVAKPTTQKPTKRKRQTKPTKKPSHQPKSGKSGKSNMGKSSKSK